jgi:2-amino-4-hydroxy-6-hydroxymethyldihydropteridine diphosphokinase
VDGITKTRRNVAVALGSNVGDRRATLIAATEALRPLIDDLRSSSFFDTPYIGAEVQPSVLNAAVVGTTRLSAHALLDRLLAVEQSFGRTRPYGGAPRTLDLDLILYGDSVIDEPGLVVPHPRFRERLFVLEPLAEIAADWNDPVTGQSVGELLRVARDVAASARTAEAARTHRQRPIN